MSDPLADRLSRLTPDAANLDRDGLLFAAGRASARPNRIWKVLAAILALSQMTQLAVLWPHSKPPVIPISEPSISIEPESPPTKPSPTGGSLVLRNLPDSLDDPPPRAVDEALVADPPPLHASASSATFSID
jgi:hypothetical protein